MQQDLYKLWNRIQPNLWIVMQNEQNKIPKKAKTQEPKNPI